MTLNKAMLWEVNKATTIIIRNVTTHTWGISYTAIDDREWWTPWSRIEDVQSLDVFDE